jgi:hypothetical protein
MTKARSNATANAAKGDLTVGNGTNLSGILAVGSNGDTIVADSSTSTGLRYQAPYSQQPVLNSAMQIWQRGTTTTSTNGSGLFGADRWKVYSGSTGRTISQQVTNDTTNLPNIQYCSRLARDNGNTNTSAITYWQNFETINTRPFSGQTVTVSFYARKGANYSEASSNLTFVVRTGTGTDQDAFYSGYTGQVDALNTNKVLTTTWQRFTSTFSIAATATEMAIGFTANFVGTAGAADYVEITGVQLELGSVATPFHTYAGTIQGELAACQRYYARYTIGNTYGFLPVTGYAVSTTTAYADCRFIVPMRTAPSAVEYGGNIRLVSSSDVGIAMTSYTLGGAGIYGNGGGMNTAGSLVAGGWYKMQGNNDATAYVGFTAEL